MAGKHRETADKNEICTLNFDSVDVNWNDFTKFKIKKIKVIALQYEKMRKKMSRAFLFVCQGVIAASLWDLFGIRLFLIPYRSFIMIGWWQKWWKNSLLLLSNLPVSQGHNPDVWLLNINAQGYKFLLKKLTYM